MPNIKSAIKRVKVSEKKRMRNKPIKSRARTMVGHVRRAIQTGDARTAAQSLTTAQSALDRAASKGVIHPNNAARRKSRIMRAVAKAARQNQ